MGVYQKLLAVQGALKAPKGQYNSFGKYSYRNCEDILEAVKPLLNANNAALFLSDTLKHESGRYYIEATATFVDCESGETIKAAAYAREEESKKGMDGSQITGASSSYARKYALNGLFCIDDTKDSDTTNRHGKPEPKTEPEPEPEPKPLTQQQKKNLWAAVKSAAKASELTNEDMRRVIEELFGCKCEDFTTLEYGKALHYIRGVIENAEKSNKKAG